MTLSILILIAALILAIVAMIRARATDPLAWSVLLTTIYLLLGHGAVLR